MLDTLIAKNRRDVTVLINFAAQIIIFSIFALTPHMIINYVPKKFQRVDLDLRVQMVLVNVLPVPFGIQQAAPVLTNNRPVIPIRVLDALSQPAQVHQNADGMDTLANKDVEDLVSYVVLNLLVDPTYNVTVLIDVKLVAFKDKSVVQALLPVDLVLPVEPEMSVQLL
jgi:hypothetical protein